MDNYLSAFEQALKIKNYARRTITIYSGYLSKFLEYSKNTKYNPRDRILN